MLCLGCLMCEAGGRCAFSSHCRRRGARRNGADLLGRVGQRRGGADENVRPWRSPSGPLAREGRRPASRRAGATLRLEQQRQAVEQMPAAASNEQRAASSHRPATSQQSRRAAWPPLRRASSTSRLPRMGRRARPAVAAAHLGRRNNAKFSRRMQVQQAKQAVGVQTLVPSPGYLAHALLFRTAAACGSVLGCACLPPAQPCLWYLCAPSLLPHLDSSLYSTAFLTQTRSPSLTLDSR